MTIAAGGSPQTFRPEWLNAVVGCCQAFVGTATSSGDIENVRKLAVSFVGALPDARVLAEDLALRSLLMNVAARWGMYLHSRAHRHSAKWRCSFDPSSTLDPFIGDQSVDAKSRFLQWAQVFSAEFNQSHPLSAAQRVAAIVRTRRVELSDAASLAKSLGVSPRQLRREVRQTFGMSLAKYVRQTRLTRALEIMLEQPGKIEPVALQVGYASKKNFYKIFRQSLGMTPSAFLHLSPEAARQVIASARLSAGSKPLNGAFSSL